MREAMAVLLDHAGSSRAIAFIKRSEPGHVGTDSVYCWHEGEFVWKVAVAESVMYPLTSEWVRVFSPSRLAVLQDAAGNDDLALTASSQESFPGFIQRLDGTTGFVKGTFLNAGHVRAIQIADLDGDGRGEVLTGGTSNAYNQGVLLVLDPDSMNGQSPSNGAYVPSIAGICSPREYLLFPRSLWMERVPGKTLRSVVNGVVVNVMHREILVTVDECVPPVTPGSPVTLTYVLDFALNVRSILLSDQIKQVLAGLVAAGSIPHIPSALDLEGLKGRVQYWNGTSFEVRNAAPDAAKRPEPPPGSQGQIRNEPSDSRHF
jgi:hypothetical protein